ncbi:hypothetical protein [Streptomyces sp. NPDC060001]|uniref:hypothetical protein n=1 Tax=Streptomyces sp. NPDC060001 TaxID=3347032 RepID=UPI0036920A8E
MTDTDPIEELTDTLYDALYAITPYAEPHFADERAGLRDAVQAVLQHAGGQQWIQKQLDQTGIRAMDFRNGMHMEIATARELLAHWVAAARSMLGDAPNYTETKLKMDVKVAESPELYTLVIQRHAPGALTPHEARQKAEARIAAVLAECDAIEHETYGQHDEDDDGMREAVRRIRSAAEASRG